MSNNGGGGKHDGDWEDRDKGKYSRGAGMHAIGYSNRLAYAVQPPHNVVSPPYGSGAINFTMLRLVSELRQPYVVMQPALWGSYPGRKICVSYVWLRCRRHTRSPPKHPKQIINNKNGAAPLCVCANIPQKTLQKRGETIAIFFSGSICIQNVTIFCQHTIMHCNVNNCKKQFCTAFCHDNSSTYKEKREISFYIPI